MLFRLLPVFYACSCTISLVQASPAQLDNKASCDDPHGRTLSNIIWSCALTIFACNWVAIHPNIPGENEHWFQVALRRAGIMLLAIFAPEIIVFWAARQFYAAVDALEKLDCNKEQEWTLTHGFFTIMGGFTVLCNKQYRPLSVRKMNALITSKRLEFPKITKKEIEDKSKLDLLSKGFTMVQTAYFVMQCIARGVQRLPITELEIVTVAFAVLSLVTFGLWLYKPLDAQCAVRVRVEGVLEEEDKGDKQECQCQLVNGSNRFLDLFDLISSWALGNRDYVIELLNKERVPTFYAGNIPAKRIRWAAIIEMIAGVVFGAVHSIAWSFSAPSRAERILWRLCCVVVISVPPLYLLLSWIGILFRWMPEDENTEAKKCGCESPWVSGISQPWLRNTVVAAVTFSFLLYTSARIVLLVLPLISLRSLPPDAYCAAQWAAFIPHSD